MLFFLYPVLTRAKRFAFFMPTLPCLVSICWAFPPLYDDVASLLVQLGQVCAADVAAKACDIDPFIASKFTVNFHTLDFFLCWFFFFLICVILDLYLYTSKWNWSKRIKREELHVMFMGQYSEKILKVNIFILFYFCIGRQDGNIYMWQILSARVSVCVYIYISYGSDSWTTLEVVLLIPIGGNICQVQVMSKKAETASERRKRRRLRMQVLECKCKFAARPFSRGHPSTLRKEM